MAQGSFRRVQVVEVDESDDDRRDAQECAPEPSADIQIEASRQGVDKAKQKANSLFAQGQLEESIRWFTKCIWLVDSKRVADVPSDQLSILHGNRALAHIAATRWAEAEADCSRALALNSANFKARYRRARARFELGKFQVALQDVDDVMKDLPDPQSGKEAMELKDQIRAKLQASETGPGASEPPQDSGFRRLQVVEVSDDESDEAPEQEPSPELRVACSVQGIEETKKQGNSLFAKGSFDDSLRWFSKGIWLASSGRVSNVPSELLSILYANRAFAQIKLQKWAEADSDCSNALSINGKNVKARYRRAMARYEMNMAEAALKDVDQVLQELPDDQKEGEAAELKRTIEAKLRVSSPKVAEPSSEPPPGFRRMQIVEASDSEEEDVKDTGGKAAMNRTISPSGAAHDVGPSSAPPAPSTQPPEGFRRMQIVEVEDSDEGEEPAQERGQPEPFPELKVERSLRGMEEAKGQGNKAFASGAFEESVRWFAKAIWAAGTEQGPVASGEQRSVLHSNRAFALVKLRRWEEAEADCSEALALNSQNVKAQYRRAMARYELGMAKGALQDIEQVLKDLPEAQKTGDALALKENIEALCKRQAPKAPSPTSVSKSASKVADGFRRLQVVEDDDSDEEPADQKKSSPKESATSPTATGTISPSSAPPAPSTQPPEGFRRMQIVEVEDSDEGEEPAQERGQPEPFPELKVERSLRGMEEAKGQGNKAFASGAFEESVRWFAKAIWAAGTEQGPVASGEQRSVLHSNRAFALVKLRRWEEAEADCSEALALNSQNVKAQYRRAMARYELGMAKGALQDIEQVLKDLPEAQKTGDALALKENIEALCKRQAPKAPSPTSVSESASKVADGFRRLQVVEDDDSDEEPADQKKSSPKESATSPTATGTISPSSAPPAPSTQPPEGFRRMQIVEVEDSDEGEEPAQERGQPEPFPELKVERSLRGMEEAKGQGNKAFASGAFEESVRWFAKAIWAAGTEQGPVASGEQRSVLHSNRAFALVKLRRWEEAEADCSEALALNSQNVKAQYRRAMARYELGMAKGALQDIEQVLKDLPEAQKTGDALALKENIEALCKRQAPKAPSPTSVSESASKVADGFRRLQVVEDDDSDEEPADQKKSSPKESATSPTATGTISPSSAPPAPSTQPPEGFRRMQIVEVEDSDEGEEPAQERGQPEPFPELKVERSLRGMEEAKGQGNKAFASGAFEESVRWFAKAIWAAGTEQGPVASGEQRSVLHSNRAFALVKLRRWEEAEADCSEALALNSQNVKAQYRRAMARYELGMAKGALQDIEQVLKDLPEAQKTGDALALKENIEALCKRQAPKAPSPTSVSESASKVADGFRRLQVVEDDDSDEEPADQKKSSPKESATSPSVTGPLMDAGFKRLHIEEVSEDESEEAMEQEPIPDIRVDASIQGIEETKKQGNSLFAKGSFDESLGWFSKGIWLASSGRVSNVPSELLSILHANRAFAQIKLQKWAEADSDCSKALGINGQNVKARYRRAMARYEMNMAEAALKDVDQVLQELPDDQKEGEAAELKRKIEAKLRVSSPKVTEPSSEPPPGFRRMQIVEASDSEEEDVKDTGCKAATTGTISPSGAAHDVAPSSTPPAPQPPEGFRRMQIVEAEDSDEEEPLECAPEPSADIQIEATRQGVDQGKQKANGLFAQGQLEESIRWFTKCIWMVDSKKVTAVPGDQHSILHANRALAYIAASKWLEAEEDCSRALGLNNANFKARYRRARARFELGNFQAALRDVDDALKEMPDPHSSKEASELKDQILAKLQ
ncbi:unnamed protein product, partial [Prorocentrum cordatum]